MTLALSIVLVFGAVGVFLGNIMVSAQVLLAALLGGAALGVWSLVRARRWYKWVIVPVELLFAGLLTFYFTSFGLLPEHRLALSVGDAFPSYSLLDQDGNDHTVEASTARRPALYVFYRGDW